MGLRLCHGDSALEAIELPVMVRASSRPAEGVDGREGIAIGSVREREDRVANDVQGVSSSSTRGTSPKTLESFVEERTSAERWWDESALAVGGGGGNATGGHAWDMIDMSWYQTRGWGRTCSMRA